VRKHARATSVRVDIRRRDDEIIAAIGDDGVGFNQAARTRSETPRFGLTTMRERAESIHGKLSIESNPGRGTTVTFSMPFRDAIAE
jgi:signal transduction histidine kinase